MKYRVTVSTTEERMVEAPNAYDAAVRAANGDRSTVLDVKQARGRPTGSMSNGAKVARPKRKMTPQARAKMLKNLEKARAARKRNVRATKKAVRTR